MSRNMNIQERALVGSNEINNVIGNNAYTLESIELDLSELSNQTSSKSTPLNNYLYHRLNANSTSEDLNKAIKEAHEANQVNKPALDPEAVRLHKYMIKSFDEEYQESIPQEERAALTKEVISNLASAFNSKPTDKFTALEEAAVVGMLALFMPDLFNNKEIYDNE